ncbi:AP-3 complex subunit delta-1-like isoform X1 [Lethenteron reissneri]|uniref:AP-3 complex subunit delta-1-like isoform X1 n=1 Tax=Lethenteron reissneri TaxID=7753 RepID=UPI002AB7DE8B|nr:AP-3 complex subunit delta-1-like isoform X1 [Lethenteron reissneri]
MALKIVKGSLDRMFDKSLQDLVRGIRNHKDDEPKYISMCIEEIKQELRQENIAVKANAVAKLGYLQMQGYDISWAAFNVIEVMSSAKFTHKRIGYMAASQSFHEGTDVLMLTTNMIRKDLSSQNQYDAGLALTGMACFMTHDLARDLANDIMTLMSSTRPYIRKKAVLIMYKVFLKYPESLRPAFPRLKEKLEDPDPGVQSAAMNVICELARRNPKNYLSLAPLFFKLMTSSTNNWVLIKIIKLFASLTPLEPRLGKKLIEPLTNLIHSTSAMSLLYECVNTVIAVLVSLSSGIPDHNASIQLCVQKLRILIEDSDQNLKYLGLLAMSRILTSHPKAVQPHKDLILQCLDGKDESIRLRALDLLYGMVSKKNLMEIVKKLMSHVDKAEGTSYRDELLTKIIDICSQSNYQHVTNFEWYVSVLVELTRLKGTQHGPRVASQLQDVAVRVRAVRPFAVRQMALLLDEGPQRGLADVLSAAAWICGEFAEHLEEPRVTLEALLRPRVCTLPGHVQAVYVHNSAKLFAWLLGSLSGRDPDDPNDNAGSGLGDLVSLMADRLPPFVNNGDLEVQERASGVLQLVRYVQKLHVKDVAVVAEVASLFSGELNPVAPKAQKKVPIPDGLDLDSWINEPSSGSEEEEEEDGENEGKRKRGIVEEHSDPSQRRQPEPSKDEMNKMREQRKRDQESNPYYIKSSPSHQKNSSPGVNHIPVVEIDLDVPLKMPGLHASSEQLARQEEERRRKQRTAAGGGEARRKGDKDGRRRRRRHRTADSEEDIAPAQTVDIVTEEMPEDALPSDDEDKRFDPKDPYRALDMDLDKPLTDGDKLPVKTHRIVSPDSESPVQPGKMSGKEQGKEKRKSKEKDKGKDKEKDRKKGKKDKKERKRHGSHGDKKAVAATSHDPEPRGAAGDGEGGTSTPANADLNDLDFWLSDAVSPSKAKYEFIESTAPSAAHEPEVADNSEKRHEKDEEEVATPGESRESCQEEEEEPSQKSRKGRKEEGSSSQKSRKSSESHEEEGDASRKSRKSRDGHSKPSRKSREEDGKSSRKSRKSREEDGDSSQKSGKSREADGESSRKSGKSREADGESSRKSRKSREEDGESSRKSRKSREEKAASPGKAAPLQNGDELPVLLPPMSRYKLLAENSHLKLTYDVQGDAGSGGSKVVVSLIVANKGEAQLKSMELNVLDSLNMRLLRPPGAAAHDGIAVPFQLPAGVSNEMHVAFNVQSIVMPQKLKGSLAFMVKTDDGSSHEKLDFTLQFTCSSYLLTTSCHSEAFAELLGGGELKSASVRAGSVAQPFAVLLARVCLLHRFSVVERLGNCASLYSRSIQDHPVCLLLKLAEGSMVSVDGKSSDHALLSNILDELKLTLGGS